MRRLLLIPLMAIYNCRGEPDPSKTAPVNPSPETSAATPALEPVPLPEDAPFIAESCDPVLPGPERARAAEERVRPGLEKALEEKGLRYGDPVYLRAFKREGVLEMWVRNRATKKYDLFRSWNVAAASGSLGPKLQEGDNQVPEGFYFVPPSAMKPDSTFHLAFNIGYPNAYDRAHSRTGTFIMVHGNAVSIGCLAMTDEKIEEIYTLCAAALRKGQPYFRVHIFPFRMTDANLTAFADSPWADFWKNLREGYDAFEAKHLPPEAEVRDGRYTFK